MSQFTIITNEVVVGKQGDWSPGNTLTATGAVLLAVSILILVIGLITL